MSNNDMLNKIEKQADVSSRDRIERAVSKRLLYIPMIKEFKDKVETEFEEKGIPGYTFQLMGPTDDAQKDIIYITHHVTDKLEEKIANIAKFLKQALLRSNLEDYFMPDYVGTTEAEVGNIARYLFLRRNHTWEKWKKEPIDYIGGPDEEEGGGGGGGYF